MMPFFIDRFLLRERVLGAYAALLKISRVDIKRIGAIGFCFGGMTVMELLRSGVDVQGVVKAFMWSFQMKWEIILLL